AEQPQRPRSAGDTFRSQERGRVSLEETTGVGNVEHLGQRLAGWLAEVPGDSLAQSVTLGDEQPPKFLHGSQPPSDRLGLPAPLGLAAASDHLRQCFPILDHGSRHGMLLLPARSSQARTFVMIRSTAASLWTSPGTITSAYCRDSSTNSLCIGRTVVRYWSMIVSSERPRSLMSRYSRRRMRTSSGVSTKTLRSIRVRSRVSAKTRMPSTMTTGRGATHSVSPLRLCVAKS